MSTKVETLQIEVNALMTKYSDFGARDSEPEYHLREVIRAGENGKPFPLRGENPWELYSSVTGWKKASTALTCTAYKLWQALLEETLGIEIKE